MGAEKIAQKDKNVRVPDSDDTVRRIIMKLSVKDVERAAFLPPPYPYHQAVGFLGSSPPVWRERCPSFNGMNVICYRRILAFRLTDRHAAYITGEKDFH